MLYNNRRLRAVLKISKATKTPSRSCYNCHIKEDVEFGVEIEAPHTFAQVQMCVVPTKHNLILGKAKQSHACCKSQCSQGSSRCAVSLSFKIIHSTIARLIPRLSEQGMVHIFGCWEWMMCSQCSQSPIFCPSCHEEVL